MCARPKNYRFVLSPPKFRGFRPYGYYGELSKPIKLFLEELEAIKLCDYELLPQLEASKYMKVSRPTFTRIYESARRKIAIAIAEARQIDIEGGKSHFNEEWQKCKECRSIFNNVGLQKKINSCPLCSSIKIEKIK